MNQLDWLQALAIIGSNIALILIIFGSTIALWMHGDKKLEKISDIQREDRKELLQISRNIEIEMRDFHNRLCEIEKNKK